MGCRDRPRGSAAGTCGSRLRLRPLGGGEDASVIGSFTPDSGLLSYRVDVVAARAQRRSPAPQDLDEVAEVVWRPPDEVLGRIVDGTLDDGMTMAAFAAVARRPSACGGPGCLGLTGDPCDVDGLGSVEGMLAVYAQSQSADDPLSGLEIGDRPEPEVPVGWVPVRLRTAALNHHDVWSLRGVGLPADRLPMVLGCDGAGTTDDGEEVVVHAVVASPGWVGDETLDPKRSLLSEVYDGTLAETVVVPRQNLVPKPAELSWEHAACLPTAWLTAYRMLFTNAQVQPGSTVLVQGAAGGVATAVAQLGSAAGIRVWVTSRDEARGEAAVRLGADQWFESGARLPERVDAVMETVGAATWSHSINSLRPGGTVVISGATSGDAPPKAELTKIFFKQLRVVGSTMGSRDELERLARFVVTSGIEPQVDSVLPLADARDGFARMVDGAVSGKVVFSIS